MEIKESLDTKPKLENDQPAWYQLLHYTKLEEQEFYNLLNEVQNDLKEISVGGADAVKHIISLLMYFQEKKVININIDEYIGYAKKNLKKIYENLSSDRLQEIDNDLYYSCTEHEHTFGLRYSIGLGLYSKDNESFKKFIEKCKEIRKDVLQSKDQKEDKDVLELRPNNPDKFYEKIKKDDIYFNSPVLEYIGTKEFVEKFLQCKNVDQDKIIKALINGYQWHNGQINTSTRKEGRSWLPDVIEQLKEIQKQEGTPFSKLRIEHYIGWLDGCFKNLE